MSGDPLRGHRGHPVYREEFAEQAFKLCLLGASDAQVADFFHVSRESIDNWKRRYPAFAEGMARGKTEADANIAKSLYHRAMGYSHPAVKIFLPKDSREPVYAHYTEYYPPDTYAASFWLKNRQGWAWKEKQEVEHTVKNSAREMTTEELLEIVGSDGPVEPGKGEVVH